MKWKVPAFAHRSQTLSTCLRGYKKLVEQYLAAFYDMNGEEQETEEAGLDYNKKRNYKVRRASHTKKESLIQWYILKVEIKVHQKL